MISNAGAAEETEDISWLVQRPTVYFARTKRWKKAKLCAKRKRRGEQMGEEEVDYRI